MTAHITLSGRSVAVPVDEDRVQAARLTLTGLADPDAQRAYVDRTVELLEQLPVVEKNRGPRAAYTAAARVFAVQDAYHQLTEEADATTFANTAAARVEDGVA